MATIPMKRISVTVPDRILNKLESYQVATAQERNDLIVELLEEYLREIDQAVIQEKRQLARREQMQSLFEKLRQSGRKAADIMLP